MNTISISFALLLVLLAILLFYRTRTLKPEVAVCGSQRMCLFCGLITSRLKACCLECGEPLVTVSADPTIHGQQQTMICAICTKTNRGQWFAPD